MRILFLGDVMGRSGRIGLEKHLSFLREKLRPDVVIVNAENAASGIGITLKMARSLLTSGIDVLTMGNHVWGQRDLLSSIDQEPRLLRPLNYPEGTPGKGFFVHPLADGRSLVVVNLLGTLFMDQSLDDPFRTMDGFLETIKLGTDVNAIFIDFHAEATSEKMALAHYLDGRVSALIGTHTHVPTADAHILSGGTAFQTDAGMCGDFNGVIGAKAECSIWRFTRKIPGPRLDPAEGEATLCGCFVVTDDRTGFALGIDPVRIGGKLSSSLP